LVYSNCPLTQAWNVTRSSETLLEQWTKTAGNDSSSESIAQWLKKWWVSRDMNGTADNVLCEEDHEANSSSTDKSAGNG